MDYKSFNIDREELQPYGLTCERWLPRIMARTDRHNEIELNLIRRGSVSYFFRDRIVTVPSGKLAIFWGLIPHKVIAHDTEDYYFVCTIPLSMFLNWRLSESMVKKIFAGEILVDGSEYLGKYEEFMFSQWEHDFSSNTNPLASILEIKARLLRFESQYTILSENPLSSSLTHTKIEKMTLFIAQNYSENLTVKEISDVIGVTPDHANAIFKKTFGHSLMRQVMIERINHAQRALLFTDDPISSIAMDCGFSSISCFNTAFRNLNNCSPSAYRKSTIK
ncbi:MAG: helix-turn-helix domain-containing protein [Muribaculaceae bacterium]|nr:helix-turn-helix domain-containing protein [Muribaculaceae bacterium]